MKHWTQASASDFAYSLSLDFFTQLESRLEDSSMKRKEYAAKLGLSAGRVSQMFNDPPSNPQLERLVEYARALGMKVSVVAYDDGDSDNEKGPIFSEIFSASWERVGKPRDLISASGVTSYDQYRVIQQQTFYRPKDLVSPGQPNIQYIRPKVETTPEFIVAAEQQIRHLAKKQEGYARAS